MCNVKDESRRIVKAAAKLIRGEILAQQYSMDTYPSTGDISDRTTSSKRIAANLPAFGGILPLF